MNMNNNKQKIISFNTSPISINIIQENISMGWVPVKIFYSEKQYTAILEQFSNDNTEDIYLPPTSSKHSARNE